MRATTCAVWALNALVLLFFITMAFATHSSSTVAATAAVTVTATATSTDDSPSFSSSDSSHNAVVSSHEASYSASALSTAFPFDLSSPSRIHTYVTFVNSIAQNATMRNSLLNNPKNLPPSMWRALATKLGEPLDGLPPQFMPGMPDKTPEQAVALEVERVNAASDDRFALLRAHAVDHKVSSGGVFAYNGVIANNHSPDSGISPSTGAFASAAVSPYQQGASSLGAQVQAASGGYIYAARVVSAVEYRDASVATVDIYRYYAAEHLISLSCTSCSSFTFDGLWALFLEPVNYWVDNCASAVTHSS